MKLLYFVLAMVLLLFSAPFAVYFAKRVFLAIRLKSLCKRRNYHLHKTHFLWFLGRNSRRSCDFHIETENGIYSVKLLGSSFCRYFPALTEDGKVYFKYFIPFLSMNQTKLVYFDGKKRHDGRFDFRYEFQENWEGKKLRTFLLIHPNCSGMFYLKRGGKYRLCEGDTACGAELTSQSKLTHILEDAL